MRYISLGRTGLSVSALGFGCMRLPEANNHVDREKAIPLLRRAYELGVNLFDTAVMYCHDESQPVLGEAVEPFRDKVVLSTKNHLHTASPSSWRKKLEESLRLLRTDYIDIYNHHGISWKTFVAHLDPDKGGLTKEMLRAKAEGLIRHIGFSFHSSPADLMKLADTGYYESVILQYNLLDQSNAEAMHYARDKGMGIVVMGPVGGGRLGLSNKSITEITGGSVASAPEAALRFVWGHPAVATALSGMGDMAMLEQNVRIAETTEPFGAEEMAGLNRLIRERKEKSGLYCTACRYCIPSCPSGVQIPDMLDLINLATIFGLDADARNRYGSSRGKASACVNCGACKPKCPQNISIPARLREASKMFDPLFGSLVCETVLRDVRPDGRFSLALDIYNFSDTSSAVELTFTPRNGAGIDAERLDMGTMAPFGRAKKLVEGFIPQSAQSVDLRITMSRNGVSEQAEKTFPFMFLRKGLSPDWQSGPWQYARPTPDQFAAQKESADKHGFRFKLSYDDLGLLLLADVRDDFLFPSDPSIHKGSFVDGLELFLDGRATSSVGRKSYEPGVYQVFIHPGTPGTHAAFHNGPDSLGLCVEGEPTATGFRLRVRIPFAGFCAQPGIPRRIGFDLAANTADAAGNRVGQYAWAGGPDNWQDASNFRDTWLI